MNLEPNIENQLHQIIDQQTPLGDKHQLAEKESIRQLNHYAEYIKTKLYSLSPGSDKYLDYFLRYANLRRRLDKICRPDEADVVFRINEVRRLRNTLNSSRK